MPRKSCSVCGSSIVDDQPSMAKMVGACRSCLRKATEVLDGFSNIELNGRGGQELSQEEHDFIDRLADVIGNEVVAHADTEVPTEIASRSAAVGLVQVVRHSNISLTEAFIVVLPALLAQWSVAIRVANGSEFEDHPAFKEADVH